MTGFVIQNHILVQWSWNRLPSHIISDHVDYYFNYCIEINVTTLQNLLFLLFLDFVLFYSTKIWSFLN